MSLSERVEKAVALAQAEATQAEALAALRTALFDGVPPDAPPAELSELKAREEALDALAALHARRGNAAALHALLAELQTRLLAAMPRAKAARAVRTLLDHAGALPPDEALEAQLALVADAVAWARAAGRAHLRQRLEARQAALLLTAKRYDESLALAKSLARDLKKLDDKLMLVEVHLTEAGAQLAKKDVAKSKAALTAARTNANAVYTPPTLTGAMDLLAGQLHSEERDYKTAYSYFYEAFETYHQLERREAHAALNYMLLTKIMQQKAHEVPGVLTSKLALKYAGPQVDALRAVAAACRARSLHDFDAAKASFPPALARDDVVRGHLDELYGELLEAHLARLVEPYSRIELSRIAEQMSLETKSVESHLSNMILEGKLNGILDQDAGHLIIYEEPREDKLYDKSLAVMSEMGHVVDVLFDQSTALR